MTPVENRDHPSRSTLSPELRCEINRSLREARRLRRQIRQLLAAACGTLPESRVRGTGK